jgi:outer membrane PBP1 activator LpoA protein
LYSQRTNRLAIREGFKASKDAALDAKEMAEKAVEEAQNVAKDAKTAIKDIAASMVTAAVCTERHKQIDRVVGNGIPEQISKLRESVSSMSTLLQTNHDAIESLWNEMRNKVSK